MVPTNKTALNRGTDRKPLVVAAVRHTVKLGTHNRALEEADDQVLPFTKGPLVFETTGAMGEETQKWCKSIVVEFYMQVRLFHHLYTSCRHIYMYIYACI